MNDDGDIPSSLRNKIATYNSGEIHLFDDSRDSQKNYHQESVHNSNYSESNPKDVAETDIQKEFNLFLDKIKARPTDKSQEFCQTLRSEDLESPENSNRQTAEKYNYASIQRSCFSPGKAAAGTLKLSSTKIPSSENPMKLQKRAEEVSTGGLKPSQQSQLKAIFYDSLSINENDCSGCLKKIIEESLESFAVPGDLSSQRDRNTGRGDISSELEKLTEPITPISSIRGHRGQRSQNFRDLKDEAGDETGRQICQILEAHEGETIPPNTFMKKNEKNGSPIMKRINLLESPTVMAILEKYLDGSKYPKQDKKPERLENESPTNIKSSNKGKKTFLELQKSRSISPSSTNSKEMANKLMSFPEKGSKKTLLTNPLTKAITAPVQSKNRNKSASSKGNNSFTSHKNSNQYSRSNSSQGYSEKSIKLNLFSEALKTIKKRTSPNDSPVRILRKSPGPFQSPRDDSHKLVSRKKIGYSNLLSSKTLHRQKVGPEQSPASQSHLAMSVKSKKYESKENSPGLREARRPRSRSKLGKYLQEHSLSRSKRFDKTDKFDSLRSVSRHRNGKNQPSPVRLTSKKGSTNKIKASTGEMGNLLVETLSSKPISSIQGSIKAIPLDDYPLKALKLKPLGSLARPPLSSQFSTLNKDRIKSPQSMKKTSLGIQKSFHATTVSQTVNDSCELHPYGLDSVSHLNLTKTQGLSLNQLGGISGLRLSGESSTPHSLSKISQAIIQPSRKAFVKSSTDISQQQIFRHAKASSSSQEAGPLPATSSPALSQLSGKLWTSPLNKNLFKKVSFRSEAN